MDFNSMIKGVQYIRETHKPCAHTDEESIISYELNGQGKLQDISIAVAKIVECLEENHISLVNLDFVFDATRFVIQQTTPIEHLPDTKQQDVEQNEE